MTRSNDDNIRLASEPSSTDECLKHNQTQLKKLMGTSHSPANPFMGIEGYDAEADTFEQFLEEQASTSEPGIELLTAMATDTATSEELAFWEEHFASSEEAVQQLEAYRAMMNEDVSPYPFLERKEALSDIRTPLPDDFWDDVEEEAVQEEEAIAFAAVEEAISELAAQEASLEEPVKSAPAAGFSLPKFIWSGQIAIAALAAFVLVMQGPLDYFLEDKPIPHQVKKSPSKVPPKKRMGQKPPQRIQKQKPVVEPIKRPGKVEPKRRNIVGKKNPGKKGSGLNKVGPPEVNAKSSGSETQKAEVRFELELDREGKKQRVESSVIFSGKAQVSFIYTYQKKEQGFLSIYFGDGTGHFAKLYPPPNTVSKPIKHGKKIKLDGFTLHPSKVVERLYVCVSKKPLKLANAKRVFEKHWKKHAFRKNHKLSWPCEYQESWLVLPKAGPKKK